MDIQFIDEEKVQQGKESVQCVPGGPPADRSLWAMAVGIIWNYETCKIWWNLVIMGFICEENKFQFLLETNEGNLKLRKYNISYLA